MVVDGLDLFWLLPLSRQGGRDLKITYFASNDVDIYGWSLKFFSV